MSYRLLSAHKYGPGPLNKDTAIQTINIYTSDLVKRFEELIGMSERLDHPLADDIRLAYAKKLRKVCIIRNRIRYLVKTEQYNRIFLLLRALIVYLDTPLVSNVDLVLGSTEDEDYLEVSD